MKVDYGRIAVYIQNMKQPLKTKQMAKKVPPNKGS